MFTVNTSKGIFKINFQHFNNPEDIRSTECHLLDENKEFLLKESAYCHENDNFNRAIGRKLSLSRMLELASKMIGFDKADRQLIWDEYFKSISNNNKKTDDNELNTIDDIVTALLDLMETHGNLEVVLPQVYYHDGGEVESQWDANVCSVVAEKDVNGELVVRIF
jgi:hypothetical protein